MRYFVAVLFAMFVVGCQQEASSKKVPIALDQVPDNVMKVAKEKLPDVTFDRALKKPDGEFEIFGKTKAGKVKEIDIKPSGEVSEID